MLIFTLCCCYLAPKTPPAYAGQRVRLERAKMGDILKAKIQQRPARQELIRQHILEGKRFFLISIVVKTS